MTALRFVLLLALVVVAACTDEGPRSGPGTLTATLVSPNGAEGAAVVVLVGDAGAVTGLGDTEAHAFAGADGTRVVLINQAGGELAFRVAVADTTQPPSPIVQEVAAPDDSRRASVTGYSVAFGG